MRKAPRAESISMQRTGTAGAVDRADRAPAVEMLREGQAGALSRETEHLAVRGELHLVAKAAHAAVEGRRLRRGRWAEPEARHELVVLAGERAADRGEVAATDGVDVAVGVHQALEQGLALLDARGEVLLGDVLVPE